MTAQIIAFPLVRRPHDVALIAGNMLGKSPDGAERYLASFKARARKTLREQGLDVEQAERQLRDFETAVRCLIWRRVLTGGGAA